MSTSFSPPPPLAPSPTPSFKKVAKKAPFMMFALEKQQIMPELRGLGPAQLAKNDKVSAMWTSQSPAERERWVRAAKEHNEGRSFSPLPPSTLVDADISRLSGKFDQTGRSMLAKKLEEDLAKYREEVMLTDIVTRLDAAKADAMLSAMRIHILHVELWLDSDDYSPPAEIGLVEMTLRGGVKYVLSQLIDPGERKIPKGLSARVLAYSDRRHRLWTDTPDLCSNYAGVLREIIKRIKCKGDERAAGKDIRVEFDSSIADLVSADKDLESRSTAGDLLPVFVMPEAKKNARKGLDWLMKKADAFYHIALYDLDHFLLELVNLFPLAERPIPTVAMASMTLQREIFLYERSVVCDYHGTIECTDCAPAIAQRQAFTICDFGCQGLDIPPVEGCHLPHGALRSKRGGDTTAGGGGDGDGDTSVSSAKPNITLGSCSAIFMKNPQTNAIDVKKTPENKHMLYQFLEGEEFNFEGPQYYSDDVLAVPHNVGPSSEVDFSDYSFRTDYLTDYETAYDTDDEASSNALINQGARKLLQN